MLLTSIYHNELVEEPQHLITYFITSNSCLGTAKRTSGIYEPWILTLHQRFFETAQMDVNAAKALIDRRFYPPSLYHLQQEYEKCIKSYFIYIYFIYFIYTYFIYICHLRTLESFLKLELVRYRYQSSYLVCCTISALFSHSVWPAGSSLVSVSPKGNVVC